MRLDIHIHGYETLRRRAAEIAEITPEIRDLVENMLEMHIPREGIGKLVLINPVIREKSGSAMVDEACLSVPGLSAPVERAKEVEVEYTTLAGKKKTKKFTGLAAQAVQHEIDHLDGTLYIDRLGVARRALMTGKLRKLRRRGGDGEKR